MGKAPVVNSDEQLLEVLATLEECRAALTAGDNCDTAELVSVAILDIRMKLNRISDAELKALCDEMLSAEASSEGARGMKSVLRRRPLLRLVK